MSNETPNSFEHRAPTREIPPASFEFLSHMPEAPPEDGTVLEHAEWEPLFNVKEHEVLNTVLVNPGDYVLWRGSAVLKALYGGYTVARGDSPNEFHSRLEMATDKDLYVSDDVYKRFEDTGILTSPTSSAVMARSSDETSLNIATFENLKQAHLLAITDAIAWLNDDVLGMEKTDYYKTQLNRYKEQFAAATGDELFSLVRFFKHDALCIKIHKTDVGSLEAVVFDPTHYLDEKTLREGFADVQAEVILEASPPMLLEVSDSFYLTYLDLLHDLCSTNSTNLEFNSPMVLWLLKTPARVVKAKMEFNVAMELDASPEEMMTKKIEALTEVFLETNRLNASNRLRSRLAQKQGVTDERMYLIRETQETLACVLLEHPDSIAFDEIFDDSVLPRYFGGVFEEHLNPVVLESVILLNGKELELEPLFEPLPGLPGNAVIAVLAKKYVELDSENALRDFCEKWKGYLPAIRFELITRSKYPKEIRNTIDPVTGNPSQYESTFHSRLPASMSEMLAILAYSFHLSDMQLERLVESWKAQGTIARTWGPSMAPIDISANLSAVKQILQKYKDDFDPLLSPTF